MEKISEHITYTEAIYSELAKRKNILNIPNSIQLVNMKRLAENVFETARDYFDVPLYISSFFRSKALNKALGGAEDSQHLADNDAAAMDIDCDVFGKITNKELFDYIMNEIYFDQLILENVGKNGTGGWIHVSYKEKGNRNQVLVMTIVNGKRTYTNY